jgi:hypothetical protein
MSNTATLYRCNVPNCSFEGPKKFFIHHLDRSHGIFTDLRPQKPQVVDTYDHMRPFHTLDVPEDQFCTPCNTDVASAPISPVDTKVYDVDNGTYLLSAMSNVRIKKSREERAGPRIRKKKPFCPYNPKRRHKKLPCPDCESYEASLRGLNVKAPEFVPSSHLVQAQSKSSHKKG